MAYGPQNLRPAYGARQKSRRLGRGNSSGRGKTAGRGTKGQRARSGGKSGTARRALKKTLSRMKKLRGFTSLTKRASTISLSLLERHFAAGEVVSLKTLAAKNLIPNRVLSAKIVFSGTITKSLRVEGCLVTARALKAIVDAGGSVLA